MKATNHLSNRTSNSPSPGRIRACSHDTRVPTVVVHCLSSSFDMGRHRRGRRSAAPKRSLGSPQRLFVISASLAPDDQRVDRLGRVSSDPKKASECRNLVAWKADNFARTIDGASQAFAPYCRRDSEPSLDRAAATPPNFHSGSPRLAGPWRPASQRDAGRCRGRIPRSTHPCPSSLARRSNRPDRVVCPQTAIGKNIVSLRALAPDDRWPPAIGNRRGRTRHADIAQTVLVVTVIAVRQMRCLEHPAAVMTSSTSRDP